MLISPRTLSSSTILLRKTMKDIMSVQHMNTFLTFFRTRFFIGKRSTASPLMDQNGLDLILSKSPLRPDDCPQTTGHALDKREAQQLFGPVPKMVTQNLFQPRSLRNHPTQIHLKWRSCKNVKIDFTLLRGR